MLKKALGLVLAACMIFGSVSVMAEEDVMELSWENVTSQEGAEDMIAQGEFVTFDEVACKIWVPSVMKPVELTEEDVEDGYIGYFSTDEGDGIAAVMYVDAGLSLEEYKDALAEEDDVTNITDVIVNGLAGIGYDLDDNDSSCISFVTDGGYILEFTFYPVSDEDFAATAMCMIASIQAEEDA